MGTPRPARRVRGHPGGHAEARKTARLQPPVRRAAGHPLPGRSPARLLVPGLRAEEEGGARSAWNAGSLRRAHRLVRARPALLWRLGPRRYGQHSPLARQGAVPLPPLPGARLRVRGCVGWALPGRRGGGAAGGAAAAAAAEAAVLRLRHAVGRFGGEAAVLPIGRVRVGRPPQRRHPPRHPGVCLPPARRARRLQRLEERAADRLAGRRLAGKDAVGTAHEGGAGGRCGQRRGRADQPAAARRVAEGPGAHPNLSRKRLARVRWGRSPGCRLPSLSCRPQSRYPRGGSRRCHRLRRAQSGCATRRRARRHPRLSPWVGGCRKQCRRRSFTADPFTVRLCTSPRRGSGRAKDSQREERRRRARSTAQARGPALRGWMPCGSGWRRRRRRRRRRRLK
mmetsp:Transcript_25101/g.79206  ORF Transcript_25101/g.79206 Transcript_25101/m.79206 type:complete len:396 (-) Transcript_25101:8-1195(-)